MSGRPRQFVDTNILVYSHDPSAGRKHDIAANLVTSLWKSREGCLSTQVLQEFCAMAICCKALTLDEAGLAEAVASLSRWRVHRPGAPDILHALELRRRYGVSFWDAMIIGSALSLGCAVIWSEDLNAGQMYDGVRVSNPFV